MNGSVKTVLGLTVLILVMALSGSLPHMYDWTVDTTNQAPWYGVVNAGISEILPMVAFLLLQVRRNSQRSTGSALAILFFALVLSGAANLSSTGWHMWYEKQFLAVLPALAAVILSIIGHAEWEYVQEVRATERRAAERARNEAAERARNERAEQEAAARNERRAAEERAAEIARAAAEAERAKADAARALAEVESTALRVEAERLEAERLAEGRRRLDEQRADLARRAAEAATRAEQATKDSPAQPVKAAPTPTPGPIRDAAQTAALVKAALAELPAGTTRAEAVKQVAAELQMTPRAVRNHVPSDWCASAPRRLHAV